MDINSNYKITISDKTRFAFSDAQLKGLSRQIKSINHLAARKNAASWEAAKKIVLTD